MPTRADHAADKISRDDADDILAQVLGPKPTSDQILHQLLSYQIIQNHRTKQMALAIAELADAVDEVKTVATATRGLAGESRFHDQRCTRWRGPTPSCGR